MSVLDFAALWCIKIKKQKEIPTDPIIFSYVTGNKHVFLFGPTSDELWVP